MKELYIFFHLIDMWVFLIVPPSCVREYGQCIVMIRVDENDIIFYMLAINFCHEGEVPGSIKGNLDLEDELRWSVHNYELCVIVVVG